MQPQKRINQLEKVKLLEVLELDDEMCIRDSLISDCKIIDGTDLTSGFSRIVSEYLMFSETFFMIIASIAMYILIPSPYKAVFSIIPGKADSYKYIAEPKEPVL